MVTCAFFLLAVSLAPAITFGFALPSEEKNDGIFNVEDITLAGSINAGLFEEDFDSEEEDNTSVEAAISVANFRRKDEDDDTDECADGMIYLSELDICVAYNPAPTLHLKNNNIYDIPQGDAPYVSSAAKSATTYTTYVKKYMIYNCQVGEIYLSELDICAPSNPATPLPPKNRVSSIYDIPQGDAPAQLVKPEDSTEGKDSNESKDNNIWQRTITCDKGEVYISELDICVTRHHSLVAPLLPKSV